MKLRGEKLPERATRSLVESPRLLKREIRRLRSEVGGGIPLLAADRLAVLESLLPSFTSQLGPPSYTNTTTQYVKILSVDDYLESELK